MMAETFSKDVLSIKKFFYLFRERLRDLLCSPVQINRAAALVYVSLFCNNLCVVALISIIRIYNVNTLEFAMDYTYRFLSLPLLCAISIDVHYACLQCPIESCHGTFFSGKAALDIFLDHDKGHHKNLFCMHKSIST